MISTCLLLSLGLPATPQSGTLVIALDPQMASAASDPQLRSTLPGRLVRHFGDKLVLDVDDIRSARQGLHSRGDLRWVEREQILQLRRRWVPDDPLYDRQWHLHPLSLAASAQAPHLFAEQAWNLSLGLTPYGRPVRIAVLDDGFDLDHPDLVRNFSAEGCELVDHVSCAVGGTTHYGPGDWHGTQTAGVIAARGDNGLGLTGVCPSCQILPVRLIHGDGPQELFITASSLAEAIVWAVDQGAAVINASWGPPDGNPRDAEHSTTLYPLADADRPAGVLSQVLDEALSYALSQGRGGLGTLIIFSAGNGNESISYDRLASDGRVMAMGAVDARGRRAYYSDFGRELFAVAPSSGDRELAKVWTTDVAGEAGARPGDYSDAYGGTSAAAAMASGVAGLIMAAYPDLSAAQVREAMALGARALDPTGGDYFEGRSALYGYGVLDASSSLRLAGRYRDRCTWVLEICGNGRDDNCDGIIDEASQCSVCVPDQGREICDGHDNNCDGRNNENFVCRSQGRPACARCQTSVQCAGLGRCLRVPGERLLRCVDSCDDSMTCADGFSCVEGRCLLDGQEGRTDCEDYLSCHRDETCNGVDDDCNGSVDDLDPNGREVEVERSKCVKPGVCAESRARCLAGAWSCPRPDSYQSTETLCDGLDNDCDGEIDEAPDCHVAPSTPPLALSSCRSMDPVTGPTDFGLICLLLLRRRRSAPVDSPRGLC